MSGILLGAIVFAVFFGETVVAAARGLASMYKARLAHRERMAQIEAHRDIARALSAGTVDRNDIPPELIEAWSEVNEITRS